MRPSTLSILLLAFALPRLGAQLPANYQPPTDWLLDPSPFTARIHESDGRLVLENGLVRREIDLRLGTTTAYLNLATGESLIRAVEPEATLVLDGSTFQAGAVTGQDNRAFLTEAEIAALQPAPGGFRPAGHKLETGPIAPRLEWKRVRHHAPDAAWPPPGRSVRLDYDLAGPLPATGDPAADLVPLFTDDFATLRPDWKVRTSPLHPRSSFENEGKPGEILTPPHTAVFAERPLAPGTTIAEATLHPGTDNSSSWGPGIVLVFSGGHTLKFNLRPAGLSGAEHPVLGGYDGRQELPRLSGDQPVDLTRPWSLRFRIDGTRVHFEARQGEEPWKSHHQQEIPADFGEATAFRVGKTDRTGGAGDHDPSGDPVRLQIRQVRFLGPDSNPDSRAAPGPSSASALRLSIHYEIHDGIPLIAKWFTLTNRGTTPVNLDSFISEQLAVVEHDNKVEDRGDLQPPQSLHVETDMAFGSFNVDGAARHTVHWETDPGYDTQVTYLRTQPCLLQVRPAVGPDQTLAPGATFTSFRTFELAHDSGDRERRGLALRRMYRTLAPWVTENPLMFHLLTSDEDKVRAGIDQAADVGFEMVILSFGSGFNAEDDSPDHLAKWKRIADHAASRGIHLGAYSLYSSRSIGGGNDIVTPEGSRPTHGSCPAITSPWGRAYLDKLRKLHEATGFLVFENDGPYPGDIDVTPRPPFQKGALDSQWVHWREWTGLYRGLRERGVYLNLPDYYYLSGSNKCGMGYREVNWSLPRAQQLIHTRQNIYDGTWEKTPSMGWMFVPLAQYHGGGAAATIEPLDQHRDHYRLMLLSNLGLGVQACYRGPRLYDTEATRSLVAGCVDWFKRHRDILESDLIHGRRADGRDLDWMLHVNPRLETRALLAVYNPTERELTREIAVPLYYSGLAESARVRVDGGPPRSATLDSAARTRLSLTVPARGFSAITFEK